MAKRNEDLRLDNQLCFALHATSRAMTRAYAPVLKPLGLTYPQYVILLVLWEEDDLAITEIGARLSLDSGSLTPLLRRMEKNGLLRRVRSVLDERQVNICLTPHGTKLQTQAPDVRARVLCKAKLTPEAGANLLSQLQKLFASLSSIESTAASPTKPKTRK